MEELNRAILYHLRAMARKGDTVPQMLREIIQRLAPAKPHKVTVIKYMRKAFALRLQQAGPIAGWSSDGTGELQDSRLNELIMPEILKNRQEWDSLDMAPSA